MLEDEDEDEEGDEDDHLGPVRDCTDVPQLVTVLVEGTGLDTVDVGQTGEELERHKVN